MTEPKPQITEAGGPEHYPVLPLRDIVVFPYMIVPLFVGREKSIAALEEVMRTDKQILLVAQKNASDDEPSTDGIYAMLEYHSEANRRKIDALLQDYVLAGGHIRHPNRGTLKFAHKRLIEAAGRSSP